MKHCEQCGAKKTVLHHHETLDLELCFECYEQWDRELAHQVKELRDEVTQEERDSWQL